MGRVADAAIVERPESSIVMTAFPSHVRLALGLLLALQGPLFGQDFERGETARAPQSEAIDARLRAVIGEHEIPGLSCAVVRRGELLFSRGYGFADLENDVPATDATVYRLASISKPVTAVLIMQLFEQGKIDLDADVRDYVSDWPEKRWPVTSRQLLAHLGGVRHYKRFEGESTTRYRNQTAALRRFADDPLLHEPGTKYRYSTFGFNLLAAVVEARREQAFGDAVREHIAEASGAETLQDDDQRRLIKGRAQGYVRRGNKLQNSRLMDSSYKLGGGGLCSSAPDLARFAAALMAGKLLRDETRELMWTEQKTADGKPVGYALGFGVRSGAGRRWVQHGGAQSRVSTMLCMLPEEQVAVVVLSNLEGMRFGGVAQEIALMVVDTQKGSQQGSEKGGKE